MPWAFRAPSATGMTWVTPSPESMTVPLSALPPLRLLASDAARGVEAARGARSLSHQRTPAREPDDHHEGHRAPQNNAPARASTAWTPMYSPATLNVSNMISAVYSRF